MGHHTYNRGKSVLPLSMAPSSIVMAYVVHLLHEPLAENVSTKSDVDATCAVVRDVCKYA